MSDAPCYVLPDGRAFPLERLSRDALVLAVQELQDRLAGQREALMPGGFVLLPETREIAYRGATEKLRALDVAVLEALFRQPGRVVAHHTLCEALALGSGSRGTTGTLVNSICVLREKLERLRVPIRILSVRGNGYRIEGIASLSEPTCEATAGVSRDVGRTEAATSAAPMPATNVPGERDA